MYIYPIVESTMYFTYIISFGMAYKIVHIEFIPLYLRSFMFPLDIYNALICNIQIPTFESAIIAMCYLRSMNML